MLILRYIQKSISSLRLYGWILSDILSPLQQLFCEGPDPFDSSLQARFLLLMLLDWPVLAVSVPSSFPECQKGQVPAPGTDTPTGARTKGTSAPGLCRHRTRVLSLFRAGCSLSSAIQLSTSAWQQNTRIKIDKEASSNKPAGFLGSALMLRTQWETQGHIHILL